jgi:urea transport system ATP-binding protein
VPLPARITPAQHKRIDEVLDIIGLSGQREALGRILAHGQKQWLEIGSY